MGRVQIAPGYSLGEGFGKLDLRSAQPAQCFPELGHQAPVFFRAQFHAEGGLMGSRAKVRPEPVSPKCLSPSSHVLNKLDDSLINLLHMTYVIGS